MVIQSLEHLSNLGSVLICHQLLGDAGLLLLTCSMRQECLQPPWGCCDGSYIEVRSAVVRAADSWNAR